MRLYFAERLLEEKVPAFCRHGCGQEFTGHLLFKHESEECPEQPMSCDYNHRGCKEKVVRSKKADHTLHCDYRQVDCPFEDCKEQVTQRQLMKHIKVGHLGLRHQQMQQVLICSLVINVLFAILFFFLMIWKFHSYLILSENNPNPKCVQRSFKRSKNTYQILYKNLVTRTLTTSVAFTSSPYFS